MVIMRITTFLTIISCLNALSAQVDFSSIEVGDYELIEVEGVDKDIADHINKSILIHSVPAEGIDFSMDTYGVLRQLEDNYNRNNGGISDLYTEVTYNEANILSLKIHGSFIGAYLSTSIIFLNFSIETGELIYLDDIVNDAGFLFVDKEIRAEVTKRIESTINEVEDDDELSKEEVSRLFDLNKITFAYPVDFSYTKEGFSFYVDYGLPHVVQAMEPNTEFKFRYSDLHDYFLKDESPSSNYSDITFSEMSVYRSLIFEDLVTYSKMDLGEGKVTCNICVNRKGNVTYAKLIDSSSDNGVMPKEKLKSYIKAVYGSKFEPNFESDKIECREMTRYFLRGE